VEFVEELDGRLRLRPRSLNFSFSSAGMSSVCAVSGEEKVMQVAGLRNPPSKRVSEEVGAITSTAPTGSSSFRRNPNVLVWIRRDLFIARRFTEIECHPAREGEKLPFPRLFRFSRDWWSCAWWKRWLQEATRERRWSSWCGWGDKTAVEASSCPGKSLTFSAGVRVCSESGAIGAASS
jgi:hypothetical protein